MSVDLRSYTSFGRISLIIMDDSLIKLEHGHTNDRMRKFMFDSIQSVYVWRVPCWVRIVVCIVFLELPGAALFLFASGGFSIFGAILFGLGLAVISWYLYAGRTMIRIVRASKTDEITGIFRPGRVRKFTDRLVAGVQRTQQATLLRNGIAPPTAQATPAIPSSLLEATIAPPPFASLAPPPEPPAPLDAGLEL